MKDNNKKAKRGIPQKSNFNEWYPFIVEAAELIDKRYPIKGMDVWRPYGWKTMRLIDSHTHDEMERTGHGEYNFPLFVLHNSKNIFVEIPLFTPNSKILKFFKCLISEIIKLVSFLS